jgi:hypothetical protein
MQGVEIEFAQQMAAGNQRNGKQQQRDRQTDGLAVFANRSSKRRR